MPTLNRFSNVLRNIGIWNDELSKSLFDFTWGIESEEPVYTSLNDYYLSKYSCEIPIRPYVPVYTTATYKTFSDNWISCELLIDTDRLGSYETGYYPFVASLVKSLAFEMFKEFQQPVYFTDEIQDGEDFDAIIAGDKTKAWQFDYAVLPFPLPGLYEGVPGTHSIIKHADYVEAWYIDRWNNK